jgi:hypothetical protein
MKNKKNDSITIQRNGTCVFLFVMLLISFGCQSKNVVKKLTNVSSDNANVLQKPSKPKTETDKLDGVVYRLPRTVVQTTVPVKRVVKEPGEFVDFAPCFFSGSELDDRTQVESIKYSIDTPTFSSRGEPDPSETYVVKTKGSYFEGKTLLMEYSPTGLLTKGEATSTNNSVDFTLKAIGTVAALGVGIAKNASGFRSLTLKENQDFTFESKTYSIPNVNCSKESIHNHLGRVKKEINNLKITSGTAINTVTTVDEAKSCLKTANGEPADAALPSCTIAGVAVNADDAKAFETLIQLIPIKEKLTRQDNYFTYVSPKKAKEEEKSQAEEQKSQLESQMSEETDAAKKKTIKGKIGAIDANIVAIDGAIAAKNAAIIALPPNSTDLSVEDEYLKAAAVYAKLDSLQTQRDMLVSTASNIPPETFNAMLDKTDESIKTYREAFLGGSEVKLWTGIVEYTPNVTAINIIFTYSKGGGICTVGSLTDLQNIKVSPSFLHDETTANPCNKTLTVAIDPANSGNSDSPFINQIKAAANPNQTSGWYYRIPARGKVTLIETGTGGGAVPHTLGISELTIAQFGTIASMPAKSAGKTSSANIVLDEATGALKNFKVSSDPLLDANTLKDAQTALQTVIDASDPVAKRKRELELLQLQNQINIERKKLDAANSPDPTPTP